MNHNYKLFQQKAACYKVTKRARAGLLRCIASWPSSPKHYKTSYHEGSPTLGAGWYVQTDEPAGAILPGGIWINDVLFKMIAGLD